ncbi:MAG TPA: putative RNA uridine N3 methyltransferase [Candidatus Acidoferrales bacterium]|nr:putative RNA uridine N3 methyltransferase [Candidatus Acidoferrales bacterium]
MNKPKLSIAIPASVISDTPHLREKTAKIGSIARSAAIFRVNEIIVYSDNAKVDQRGDLNFIALLLNYLETPQYLRKALFKLDPDLQYAGILPPLRTPHHPVSGKIKHLKVGEYREGIVFAERKDGLSVDIGVQQPALLRQKQFSLGERLTLQVVKVGAQVEVQPVSCEEVPQYWGYTVRVEKRPFGQIIKSGEFDLTVATARIGDDFMAVADQIGERWGSSANVLVAFGAPARGLHEIVEDEHLKLADLADFIVNTIPEQGTATVRAEEALLATLAIFNIHFNY